MNEPADRDELARALEQMSGAKSRPAASRPAPGVRPAPAVRSAPSTNKPPAASTGRRSSASSANASQPRVRPKRAAAPDQKAGPPPGPELRRTFIPILLTAGLIAIVLASMRFLWIAPEDPMGGTPAWLAGALFGLGALLWLLAAVNMLIVRNTLRGGASTVR